MVKIGRSFRGQGGLGKSDKTAPSKWSESKNVAWKAKLPGRGASSAIIFGDKVFLTAYDGYGLEVEQGSVDKLKLFTICIDKASGKILWQKSVNGSSKTQAAKKRVVDHGFATGTSATDGKVIVSHFGVSGLVAYDFSGKQLWTASVGSKTTGFGSASSPIIFENLVIVNASIESKSVYAFDKTSGKKVWQIEDVVRSWSVPCIGKTKSGTSELVVNQKDIIRGFDPKTGKQLWECSGIKDYTVPQPISRDGVVYCLGGRSNRFIAIKLGGRGDVTQSHKLWEVKIGANVTSPIFYKDHLYWASDKGITNCVKAQNGEMVFRERMPTRSRVYASMVRAGENLYLTMRDSGILVIKAQPEYKVVSQNNLDSENGLFNATPAFSDGMIFIRSDRHLYCISEKPESK